MNHIKKTFQLLKLDNLNYFWWNVYTILDAYCLIFSVPMMKKKMMMIIITIMKFMLILKKKQKHTQTFIFFNLYPKWQNMNTCSLSQISSRTNILFYQFNFTGWREEEKRGADVMTSERQRAGTLHPLLARPPASPPVSPPEVRRDTRYQGGSRRASHLLTSFLHRPQSPLSFLYGGYYFQLFFLGWYGGSFQK